MIRRANAGGCSLGKLPFSRESDGAFHAGAEVVAGASYSKKRRIHPLDVNPTVLHGLAFLGDFDDLASGCIGIGEGSIGNELFHTATRSSLSAPRSTILTGS
jgi:hypothetical protein